MTLAQYGARESAAGVGDEGGWGGWFDIKMPSYQYRKSHIVEIRRSYDHLISIMGSSKLVRRHLCIESRPRSTTPYGPMWPEVKLEFYLTSLHTTDTLTLRVMEYFIQLTCYHLADLQPHPDSKFMGPTWGPPGSCRPLMGPMLAPWTLLSGQCLVHQII